MPSSSIPAVLKRLGELHAIYSARGSPWWKRWDTKQRTFRYLTRYGSAILEHINQQQATIQYLRDTKIPEARREGFYTGRIEQEKYDRLFAQWKKTRKGKEPKAPKPL